MTPDIRQRLLALAWAGSELYEVQREMYRDHDSLTAEILSREGV